MWGEAAMPIVAQYIVLSVVVAVEAMREGDEFAIEASGSGSYGQLDRRRAGPPGRVRSPRFGNRARFQIGTTQHETRGRFFFSARAVTPMPNSPKENLILGPTKKPSLIDHRSVEPRVDRDTR